MKIKQYLVSVNGQEIGFVEATATQVYDKISTAGEWKRNPDGSFTGERTAGSIRRINNSKDAHTFHSRHPLYRHLDGQRAIVGIAPIFEGEAE